MLTPKPPKTKKTKKPTQQRSNKPYNNQAIQKPKPPNVLIKYNNLSAEPTDTQQATTPTTKPQLQRRLISPQFQESINWWQGHIKYNNIRTRNVDLLLSNCFLTPLPRKGRSIMKQMKRVSIFQLCSGTIEWVFETIAGTWKTWKRQRQRALALILPEHEQIQVVLFLIRTL